jgi:hypothetical protein
MLSDKAFKKAGLYRFGVKPSQLVRVRPSLGVIKSNSDLALSRLALLPEPTDVTLDGPERYAQSAWQTIDKFTYDPDLYTEPVLAEVNLDELLGTDPNLSRKKIEAHITGKALTTNGHYALVVVKNGDKVILDGHHRLMAQWLLGNPTAQVWLVEEK